MVKVVQSQNQEKLNREISVDLASQVPPKTFFVCSIDFLKPEGLLDWSKVAYERIQRAYKRNTGVSSDSTVGELKKRNENWI